MTKNRYRFKATVLKMVEEFRHDNWRKDDNGETTCDKISLGWFVLLSGSHEKLYMGEHKPDDLKVGDQVRITIEREG